MESLQQCDNYSLRMVSKRAFKMGIRLTKWLIVEDHLKVRCSTAVSRKFWSLKKSASSSVVNISM